jgi:hypothetical protein
MRIGVIIPDRGDRPGFLENCLRMIKAQTLKPAIIELVNDEPTSKNYDITKRYRMGYDRLRNKDLDIIALMENDDWYAPEYLETMISRWISSGKPEIFGLDHTIYYHIRLFAHFTMNHSSRSSAMNTIVKPDLNFKWCPDHEPYTDIHLWNTLKGTIISPEKTICMGIKHGIGLCGGRSHLDRLHRYINPDEQKEFLKATLDQVSFEFYSKVF